MNGQYAIKGYLFQSLVALLDSFELNWETVCVEPNDESEKVDIRWTYHNGEKKVVQVKSSKNLISLPSVKQWANELKNKTSNAKEYELILVGAVADNVHKIKNIGYNGVHIISKDYSINDFEDLLISKINTFFEKKGVNLVTPKLARLFVRALNQQILQNSVIGKNISFSDFKNSLLDSLQTVERHLEKTSYSLILPNASPLKEDVKSIIMNHILNLIGWKSFNQNENINIYNEKLGENENFSIDYWGYHDSPLKDDRQDIIYIQASLDAEYPIDLSEKIKYNMFCVDHIRKNLIENGRIDSDNKMEFCIQFFLSLKESEQGEKISGIKELYKNKYLNKDIIYYSIDNKQIDFLTSSIITAKKYREDLVTKFLYPITDDNSQIDKIGKRSTYLPPQYINSSILPIIKEDNNKISVLLFCSDPYSQDRLKKVIWLLIRLTSGLANEYKVYFTDYEDKYKNEVNEIIRSYKNSELTSRVNIEKLYLCNCSDLQIVPQNINENLKDEDFNEVINQNRRLRVEPHLIEYLPYGDSLKPFLDSDAIKSDALKLFLENKGIILKTADKTKIIQLMTSLLFSPLDIESLVEFVNINDKPFENSSAQYSLSNNSIKMHQIASCSTVNQSALQEGLKANIILLEQIKPENEQGEYTFKIHLEQKNPNKQALVSIVRSTAKVTLKIDNSTNKLEFSKEYNSRPARAATERLVNQLSKQLIHQNIIEDNCIDIRFSEFTNKERINFLLSFTNIDSSTVFTGFNAKSLKYMFDEFAVLPNEYQDKKGKECVTHLKGRNLDTIKELQNEILKDIILSEEFSISYRYRIRGISGNYYVIMNFSGALTNKPNPDGVFNFKGINYIDSRDKQKVVNSQTIENELKKEFNRIKKEKLMQFNKI